MATAQPNNRVIVYGYAASPFYQKITFLLDHYGVEWTLVDVPPVMPRPMLSKLLGITYRRIPVVFIDGQAYIDTTAASLALERAFGGASTNKSLLRQFPALQMQLAVNWAESSMFRLGAGHLYNAPLNETFVKDRKSFMPGSSFDSESMKAKVPFVRSQLTANLEAIESHLKEQNGKFLFGDSIQYLDVSLYTPMNWVQTQLRTGEDLLPTVSAKNPTQDWSKYPFPRTLTWMAAVREYLAQHKIKPVKLTAEQGAEVILKQAEQGSQQAESALSISKDDALVKAGWFSGEKGQTVSVTPVDTGRVPQVGQLVGLDGASVTIKVKTEGGKSLLATFPRINFDIRAQDSAKL
ncbi:Glutathione S-transferase, N-terminal [Kalmanozyma brasiliensis GHG001]|uniref:GST N-terminal domain-containing protein n=1 Tax=Kalmanozyma brasiliensis (strain GHG001) TaxID=1365824 RepID=V5GI00_KALBG|nr:Glutathione S-transferase, N-terminal [Kalmanozyma brasiliensis GHG001]EST05582.1 Glutathione S-transferase, N-terminal [Kalmanozyma brasiliensis GHG001]